MQFVFAVAHDDDRRFALGGGEGLRGTIAITTLGHDRIDFRQAWKNARHRALGHVCCPVAIDGADDLEFRMLFQAFFNACMDVVIHGNTRKAADFQKVAAVREALCQIIDLAFAHGLEVDCNAPCAGFGDSAVEGNDCDAGIAGFLDRAVQSRRRGRIDDDRVVALQDHVLDLRGLFGRLIFSGGEGIGRRHDTGLYGFLGDLVPALQHGLTP